MLIDTHCHLDQLRPGQNLPDILAAAVNSGVNEFVVPGVDPDDWSGLMGLVSRSVHAAPGIHPMHAAKWSRAEMERLCQLLPKSVAVGEIGLDYYDGMPEKETQKQAFRKQIGVARDIGLPLIIHCRKAFADLYQILKEEKVGELGGVMHAFSGSIESARQCVDLGLKIGISGSVTWVEAHRPAAMACSLGIENILLETDSPDMAPQSRRGGCNEPALLVEIAEKVSRLKGLSVEDVARITTQNAKELFKI